VLLAGVPPELESQLEDYDPKAHLPAGHEWALRQEELREVRSEAGYNRGEGAQRVADAEAYVDHIDLLNDALAWAGLSADLIYEAQAEGMSAMLPRIPTLHASAELQRLRHIASPRRFDANDLGDLSALPAAIVYCDVVVTEKEWAAAARRAKLDTYNDTVVLSDLTELPLHLV
jgi:hypothetical protein